MHTELIIENTAVSVNKKGAFGEGFFMPESPGFLVKMHSFSFLCKKQMTKKQKYDIVYMSARYYKML